jgi:nitrite reductase (NADH) small subunit
MEITLGMISSVPPGEGRAFQVGSDQIAVFHTRGGQIFATQARCPHRGGPLADGLLGGNVLICPLHGRKFDLRTGDALATPDAEACGLRTYGARVDSAGRILVKMDSRGNFVESGEPAGRVHD